MAHAQSRRAARIVTFGGLESNHARLTAAAAQEVRIDAHVLYFERRPESLEGNSLLAQESGAHLHFIPFGRTTRPAFTIETANRIAHAVALAVVGSHYFVPVGGSSWRGCLGYVRAAVELDGQARALGIDRAWVVVPTGTGGTLAGMLAGLALAGSSLRPLGIDVGNLWRRFPRSIARTATAACAALGSRRAFAAADVPLIQRTYVGDGYAAPSSAGWAAIERLGALEGLALDPVYTGKAFAGLLDLAERGRLGRDDAIVFVHTGGVLGNQVAAIR